MPLRSDFSLPDVPPFETVVAFDVGPAGPPAPSWGWSNNGLVLTLIRWPQPNFQGVPVTVNLTLAGKTIGQLVAEVNLSGSFGAGPPQNSTGANDATLLDLGSDQFAAGIPPFVGLELTRPT